MSPNINITVAVAGVTAVACIPAAAANMASLQFSDGLTAADFTSLLLWRPHGVVGVPAVAFVPAVAGVLTVAGVLALANVPAYPGVPILADVFTYFTIQCTLYYDTYSITVGYRTIGLLILDCYFFCYRTIGILNIGHENSRN